MKATETLLGYDLREKITVDSGWTSERKERNLLNPDTEKPLSIDEYVWSKAKASGGEKNYMNLSNDLENFKKPGGKSLAAKGKLVAMTIVRTNEKKKLSDKYFKKSGAKAYSKKSGWKLIGYDVCNKDRISLLTNFDHGKMGVSGLFKKWGKYLNHHHLFDTLDYAMLFRDFSDSLYPEEETFFIFGIYEVPIPK